MSTTIESLELEIKQNGNSAAQGIDALSASLTKLKTATKGGIGLTSVATQISKINTALNGANPDKLAKFADSLSKLSTLGNLKISSTIAKQLTNIGTAADGLKSADFSGIEKMASALAPLSSYKATGLTSTVNALKKLPVISSMLSSMDWSSFTDQIQKLTDALEPLSTRLSEMPTSFSKLPSSFTKAINATNKLTAANTKASNSYLEFYAKAKMAISAVKGIASKVADWISNSAQYIEDMNLFNVAMGEYAEKAYNYAQSVSDALGIDPGEFMRNQGVFNTIIKGFGVASDKAYMMSENLTRLSYDIASFYNISTEDAFAKVQSGIAGELEPLRRLGYDLSVARLQQEAYNLGISKSVSEMTQAEKSQLRYCAILTQVTDVQGDMTRTLASPANQLRILRAQLTLCARSLGNIFLPLLKAIIPYAIAAAKAIRTLIDAVAALFGFELTDYTDAFNSTGSSIGSVVEDTNNEIDDTTTGLGKASDAAKKLKNNLLGIDELNIISPETADTLSGGTGSGIGDLGDTGDLGIDLPSYDWDLANLEVDTVINNIKNSLSEIEAVVSGFALAIGTILVVSGVNIPLGIGLMALGAVGLVHVIATNWNGMSEQLANVLADVTAILGGFLLAIGAVLTFSGANLPLGIGLMVAGAALLATSAVINWKFLNGNIESVMDSLKKALIGLAIGLLVIGAILAFTGANLPLGLGLMATGAVGLATQVNINWGSIASSIKNVLKEVGAALGAALFAVGAILAFSGVATPAGIALMVAGMASTAAGVALNWGSIVSGIKGVLKEIGDVIGVSLAAIGLILCLSGVAIPLGIGLIAAGVAAYASSDTGAMNWSALRSEVESGLSEISDAFDNFAWDIIDGFDDITTAVGDWADNFAWDIIDTFDTVKESISNWGANIAEFFVSGNDGKNFIDNVSEWFREIGEAMWEGIKEGWENSALKKIYDWVKSLIEKFKDALGIHSPSTVFRDEIGVPMAEGLLEGIAKTFKNITKWVKKNIIDPISKAFEGSSISDLVINITAKITEWKEELVNKVIEFKAEFTKWVDNLRNKVVSFQARLSTWRDALANKVVDFKARVTSWAETIVSKVIDFKAKVTSWSETLTNKVIGFEAKMTSWKDALVDKTVTVGAKITSWTESIYDKTIDFKAKITSWVSSLVDNVIEVKAKITSWFSGLFRDPQVSVIGEIASWVNSIIGTPTIDTKAKVTGMDNQIPSYSNYLDKVKAKITGVENAIPTYSTDNTLKGMKAQLTGAVNEIPNYLRKVSDFSAGITSWSVSTAYKVVNGFTARLTEWKDNLTNKYINFTARINGMSKYASGGIIYANGRNVHFANGGSISANGIPHYAGGSTGVHGSMFVAGEAGAEIVGHINGTTEVLNRFQLGQVMHSSLIDAMAQFVPLWRNINSTLIASANAIIRSVIGGVSTVTGDFASETSYDPSYTLSQTVYDENRTAYNSTDSSMYEDMREFYVDYMEQAINRVVAATEKQADKNEQTIVQIGNRSINDAVVTQKRANGYVFA